LQYYVEDILNANDGKMFTATPYEIYILMTNMVSIMQNVMVRVMSTF
jgi:hypothetical protein